MLPNSLKQIFFSYGVGSLSMSDSNFIMGQGELIGKSVPIGWQQKRKNTGTNGQHNYYFTFSREAHMILR